MAAQDAVRAARDGGRGHPHGQVRAGRTVRHDGFRVRHAQVLQAVEHRPPSHGRAVAGLADGQAHPRPPPHGPAPAAPATAAPPQDRRTRLRTDWAGPFAPLASTCSACPPGSRASASVARPTVPPRRLATGNARGHPRHVQRPVRQPPHQCANPDQRDHDDPDHGGQNPPEHPRPSLPKRLHGRTSSPPILVGGGRGEGCHAHNPRRGRSQRPDDRGVATLTA